MRIKSVELYGGEAATEQPEPAALGWEGAGREKDAPGGELHPPASDHNIATRRHGPTIDDIDICDVSNWYFLMKC